MIEVVKKRGESLSAMLRRFNRKVQQSGVLLEARKSRFFKRPKSTKLKKKSAIRREKVKNYREYLIKIGKISQDERVKISKTDLDKSQF